MNSWGLFGCVLFCVGLLFACPGVLHLEHQVALHGTAVTVSHEGGHFPQRWSQTPHLGQDGGQKLMGILNRRHTVVIWCSDNNNNRQRNSELQENSWHTFMQKSSNSGAWTERALLKLRRVRCLWRASPELWHLAMLMKWLQTVKENGGYYLILVSKFWRNSRYIC